MSEDRGLEAGAMSAKARSRDELLEEVLSSVAEIGKRWGFELPIGRIWAFPVSYTHLTLPTNREV